MIYCFTNQKLQFYLGGAVTTNQLPFICTAINLSDAVSATNGVSNNTTAVDLCAAASGLVRHLEIYNLDTVSATVYVQYNDNGTLRIIRKATLAAGATLVYDSESGWNVDLGIGGLLPLSHTDSTKVSNVGTNTHAQVDTHLAAAAAVHGLPASANVLGNKSAAGEFVQRGSQTLGSYNQTMTVYFNNSGNANFPVAFPGGTPYFIVNTIDAYPSWAGGQMLSSTQYSFAVFHNASTGTITVHWIAIGA